MNIELWLEKFKRFWLEKDISSVMDLFTSDVEYYETPFQIFENKSIISKEWEYIYKQKISLLDFEVFAKEGDKFVVLCDLKYKIQSQSFHFKWTYLMKLNSDNKCYFFVQYWEKILK